MLKKTIVYKDVEDNDIEEDFYFNLNKAEIAEMELSQMGGLSEYLKKIVSSRDGSEIIGTFKNIIAKAIGRRSDDLKRFEKSDAIAQDFFNSDAYNVLFLELLTDASAAAEFIRAIVPADLAAQIPTTEQDAKALEAKAPSNKPAWYNEGRVPTEDELKGATPDLLMEAFRRKNAAKPE